MAQASPIPAATPLAVVEKLERETVRRVAWRLVPPLMLGNFCAHLDRGRGTTHYLPVSPD
jgi:hypothetical protein